MWTLNIHGDTSHLQPDVARELEEHIVSAVHSLVSELVPAGHQGVAATFQGDHYGPVNLVDPTDMPAGTPAPDSGAAADGTPGPAPDSPPPSFPGAAADDPAAAAQS